jgi:putative transposase
MGRSRYKILEPDQPHFVTCTVLEWLPLFTRPETVDILLDSLRYLQSNAGLKVYAWVVLENHLHMVVQAPGLGPVLARFKSWTAHEIVRVLTELKVRRYLERLAFAKRAHKDDREHQVWQEGSHPELIGSLEMMTQKVEYIHRNPVKRGYVDLPEHWRWSSARSYLGDEGLIEVCREW